MSVVSVAQTKLGLSHDLSLWTPGISVSFTWKIKTFLYSRFLIPPVPHRVLPYEMDYHERGPFKFTFCSGYVKSAGLFRTLTLTAAWSAWTVIVRLPESIGKWRVQRMIKNVHISYPLDHHYFVPSKPQRWFPEIGVYGRKRKWKKTYKIQYEEHEQL